ncbi:ParB/RepB/Spo0J family partition protein [Helicobacter winghamensis]|uniref:Chromosome partitioning protein ParB n=1 Tax=Helicobacter winghamensis TaxID=157268 RepID=A0A2N3PL18_9HELI|nr:ParB/RepB/Spo0J family partition protein [Helicobacter winghamensis]EEO26647.1 ParB-like protein [Helicobacter winghamensis ATCC BAA-430]PKT79249.1 chromosome partitioning protein ParB [Helicobacter winghamensis]PKT79305.1 chromosome partitioning protein ParB [Helicobacter winghamensis]PKT79453.1 chromosome partitioning protein ParB [Helicobacter winghamensis]PKT82396.1 chromosome partitioning protein ParB [Helicobacter winghamensis]
MAKKGLGRGLGAILSEVEEAYQNDLQDNSGLVVELDIDKIKPNPLQPRKVFEAASLQELATSIEEHGLLQPILVYEDSKDTDFYYLIAGERRLRASKLAKKESIKAIIVDVQMDKLRELALIENIQREDLNPIDLARSYKELIDDYGITHEEMAKRLSKSRTQITNTLRLLDLSKEVQDLVLENKISQGHAKILVTLPKEQQNLIANSIVGQKLSVHATEKIVKNCKETKILNKIPNFKNSLQKQKDLNKDSIAALKTACAELKSNGIMAFVQKNRLIVEFSNDEEVKKFSKILPL